MAIKVLIIEEKKDDGGFAFNAYVICSMFMGYEYYVCHKYDEIPQTLEAFTPDIVFFIIDRFTRHVVNYIDVMREFDKNLKIILASDMDHSLRGKGPADFYLNSAVILPNVFQKVITEHLFTNLYDDSSLVKEVRLDLFNNLSDNALRAIAAEQMWEAKERYLEKLIKWKNEGEGLNQEEQKILEEYIQRRDLLLQRKAKAAEILIARGCEETAEQLMNPENE